MSSPWSENDTLLNDRYEPVQKLGQGAFGVVFLAKFRAIPEPHPCSLGEKADLSSSLRGVTIPEVMDLTGDMTDQILHPVNSRMHASKQKENLLEATDQTLSFSKDWWRVLSQKGPIEENDSKICQLLDVNPASLENDVFNEAPETKRELEVYRNECERVRDLMPQLGAPVAVKKMNKDRKIGNTFGLEPLREVRSLAEMQHPHIVRVYEIFLEDDALHMVMEVLKSNLDKVIKDTSILLSAGDIKQYMRMTLVALAYLHTQGACHRDLKPENLLIGDDGVLKLADFGGTKPCGTPETMSPQACTIWYRAPELLMGSRSYGTASDIWSAGCVFGELFRRSALFQGSNNLDQLAQIVSVCGTPTEKTWSGVTSLAGYVEFEPVSPMPLKELFGTCSPASLDLLSCMLSLDPTRRPTADEALSHPYFTSEAPSATPVSMLPKPAK